MGWYGGPAWQLIVAVDKADGEQRAGGILNCVVENIRALTGEVLALDIIGDADLQDAAVQPEWFECFKPLAADFVVMLAQVVEHRAPESRVGC